MLKSKKKMTQRKLRKKNIRRARY